MKAKLSDLIEALDFQSEDNPEYFDRQAGRIVSVSREVLDGVESGDQAALADLPDWQREQVEQATALAADDGKRFIATMPRVGSPSNGAVFFPAHRVPEKMGRTGFEPVTSTV